MSNIRLITHTKIDLTEKFNPTIIIPTSIQYPSLHNRNNLPSTPTIRKNNHNLRVIQSVGNKQHPAKRRTDSLVNQMQFQSGCNRRHGSAESQIMGYYLLLFVAATTAKSYQPAVGCANHLLTFASLICANRRDRSNDGDADLFPFGCTILFPFPCRFIAAVSYESRLPSDYDLPE